MKDNYTVFHLHTHMSNSLTPDSTSDYHDYIDLAVKNDMTAIAYSEHGGVFEWIKKKQECDKAGLKYIHGQEFYLTTTLEEKLKETFHIGLYARNWDGVKELNGLSSIAYQKDNHYYYKPRISLDELFNTSKNIIITTACLGSIFYQRRNNPEVINPILEWVSKNNDRTFFEIQYHNHPEQIEYNQLLCEWSKKYNVRLIAGTDTHSATSYDAECRKILQKAKNMSYGDEDTFDLTFKTYDELIDKFKEQNSLPEEVFMEAIENTNYFASMVEDFKLDKSFKYPNLYEDEEKFYKDLVTKKYREKIKNKVIDDRTGIYKKSIQGETVAFKKLGMFSFMSFMSEMVTWAIENGIPRGFNRGSVGGSVIAYILDIIDLDPIKWNTVFSRFCNEDRISLGDIDVDYAPEDREKIYQYIISRFPKNHTGYIITFNTISDKGTIDEIGRALKIPLDEVAKIKDLYESDPEQARNDYPDLFYYFDGLKGTIISKGMHPAGMIASPISLNDNIGFVYEDDMAIVQCGMKAVDSLNYVKFDILGLKNIGIIKKTYKYLGIEYQKSHEIDWNDQNVWNDMIKSPVGLFQFEAAFAFDMLKQFEPKVINDMSIVNAAIRPSGASYRDNLMMKKFHKNPSEQIDELLKDNLGYLIFQEDTIKFLTDICGFSGAEADNVRRAIGKKLIDEIEKALPKILDGYCAKSDKPREIAEEEAKQFIQVIQDSSDYQFGLNHSTGYSMIGYLCAYLRYYYPLEFTTAFLNSAANEDDIKNGTILAHQKGIEIKPIKFRRSQAFYSLSKDDNSIYKGIQSIKFLNDKIADELYELGEKQYDTFTDLLIDITENTSVNTRQLDILIKLNFFSEFGGNNELFHIYNEFSSGENQYKKTYVQKTKDKRIEALKQSEQDIRTTLQNKNKNIAPNEMVMIQREYLGYADITYPTLKEEYGVIVDIDTKYAPKLYIYLLRTGEEVLYKMDKKTFNKSNLDKGILIKGMTIEQKKKKRKNADGEWIEIEETEPWLKSCAIIK